jgi:hypothetical protein
MEKVRGPARPGGEAAPVERRGTGRQAADCRLVSTEGTPDLWKMLGGGGPGDLFVDGRHYTEGEPRHADYAGDSRRARDTAHPGPVRTIIDACDKEFVDALGKSADSIHDHHRPQVLPGATYLGHRQRGVYPLRLASIRRRVLASCR